MTLALLPLQPAPYHAFSEEVAFLETQFGQLNGSAYVMGDALHGLQWHIYAAGAPERQTRCSRQAQASIELCMMHLCPNKVSPFQLYIQRIICLQRHVMQPLRHSTSLGAACLLAFSDVPSRCAALASLIAFGNAC